MRSARRGRKLAIIRSISRFMTTVAVSGSLALAGLGLGAGPVQADPSVNVMTWCPGQAPPDRGIRWDMNVCHNYFITKLGTGNVPMVDYRGNPTDSWFSADIAPPVLTPPPPPPPPTPDQPFCTPRGGLWIVGPICDEIGVGPH
ncbi:MAG: hypothetical protein WA622_17300 [Mycobacterium sp.]|uniref:hypothetical protein n=1 Tax=Mycobacterium sp. TaxID=1785 RepID=UPI003BB684A5